MTSTMWEPGAALPSERMQALAKAHRNGISTWVSFEPVLYPEAVSSMIRLTEGYVDHYKVGKLNYIARLSERLQAEVAGIDWRAFGYEVEALLKATGKPYDIKAGLRKEMTP
jgi:DNA repair photolyase